VPQHVTIALTNGCRPVQKLVSTVAVTWLIHGHCDSRVACYPPKSTHTLYDLPSSRLVVWHEYIEWPDYPVWLTWRRTAHPWLDSKDWALFKYRWQLWTLTKWNRKRLLEHNVTFDICLFDQFFPQFLEVMLDPQEVHLLELGIFYRPNTLHVTCPTNRVIEWKGSSQ